MFMIYLCTKFYTSIYNDSLIIAIKPIDKRMFVPHLLVFLHSIKSYLKKSAIFLEGLLTYIV